MNRIATFIALSVSLSALQSSAALVSVANPQNVLAGATDNVSSQIGITGLNAGNELDGSIGDYTTSDNGLLFNQGDTDQRISIQGFNSALTDIRLFGLIRSQDPNRSLNQMTVYSSTTSQTSLNSTNYTLLVPTITFSGSFFPSDATGATPGSVAGSLGGYVDFAVNAPAGTQSLLFDFGSSTHASIDTGDRVGEIQAFNVVPEPTSICLMGIGMLVLGARSWRGVRNRGSA
jgi:hypothetical protein